MDVFDRHAPYKRKIVRGVKCSWLTGETKKLMNQREFFLRKARRSGADVDQSVTLLVNLALTTGIVPDEWRQARVVLLHKSGRREVMGNYRPISILPVISKIAEKAVNVQLQQYLNQHGLLNSFQSGFRRYHSTQTAVTYFCDTIRRSTDAGKLTGALFIDLKKAFDTVPHYDLICKLKRFGLEENSLAWLTNDPD